MKTTHDFGHFPIIKCVHGIYVDICRRPHIHKMVCDVDFDDASSGFYTGIVEMWVLGWGNWYCILCVGKTTPVHNWYSVERMFGGR